MTRLKASLGAALLFAICIYAFGASTASATTIHVCKEAAAGPTEKAYEDVNCSNENAKGKFRTVPATKAGTKGTPFSITNQVLSGTVALNKTTITCTTLTGSGEGENLEPKAGVMEATGKKIVLEYSKCTVNNPAKCTVKTPIKTNELTSVTKDEAAEVMKVVFTPPAGKPFAIVKFESAECPIKGAEPEVTGTASGVVGADPSVLQFTATSGSKFKLGGAAATYTGESRATMEGTSDRLAGETP